MENMTLFINSFLSYFLVFVVFIAAILCGGFIGTSIRKSKNAQAENSSDEA